MSSSTTVQTPAPESSEADVAPAKVEGRSPFRLAVARFRRDRLSMVAFWIVVVYVVIAVASPILQKFGVLNPFDYHATYPDDLLDVNTIPNGVLGGIAPNHWLGVEPGTGRDVLSRILLGVSLSLGISLVATILTMTIGTVAGIVSGFTGGIVDAGIGRLIDLTLAFPSTLMLLALSNTVTGLIADIPGIPADQPNIPRGLYIMLVLAVFGWPPIARVVRGQVLTLREREFVEAAKLFGASRRRIYFKEILPNLWAPLLVYFTLTMPAYISAEAALSYLGVGIQQPTPTLGNVLTYSLPYAQSDFLYFFAPALFIAVIVIAFNLLGDGLRDALDPKGNR